MIALLPFKYFEIDTELTISRARKVLLRDTDTTNKHFFHKSVSTKHFEGRISKDGFGIMPTLSAGQRNSFLPVLHGHFIQKDHGTRICIWMTLHPLVIVFMLAWFGFNVKFFIDGGSIQFRIFALIGILFGYLLMIGIFDTESRDAIDMIKALYGSMNKSFA